MTFPSTPLPYHVEVAPAGEVHYSAWVDITDDVRTDQGVSIEYGRSGEDSKMQSGQCSFKLTNTSGNYTPGNPMGAYYPNFKRNTPVRVWIEQDESYLDIDGGIYSQASAFDHASLDITGDIDIRWDGAPVSWGLPGWIVCLIGKIEDSTNNRSWAVYLSEDGYLSLLWSTAGTAGSILIATSTEPVPFVANHRGAVRVTLDVNNGASGNTTTFYTSDTIDGTWTQLGDAVVKSGTTSIYSGAASIEIACPQDTTFDSFRCKVYAAQVRSGIGGTIVASPDWRALAPGTGMFTDSAGRQWTSTNATTANRFDRFHGLLADIVPVTDMSGNDVTVDCTASGILRRLSQGESPLESTLRRGVSASVDLIDYWPMEDEQGATTLASANSGRAMRMVGAPSLASYSEYACSKPIVTTSSDTELVAPVRSYTPSAGSQVFFLMSVPTAGATNNQELIAVSTTGATKYWTVTYGTGGTMRLRGYSDPDAGTTTVDTGAVAFAVNGLNLRVSLEMTQSGGNVAWTLAILEVGQTVGSTTTGTAVGTTCGRVTSVVVSPGTGLTDVSFGHLSVHSSVRSIFDLYDELRAYDGELATDRAARLCAEQGIEFIGTSAKSTAMGPQLPETFTTLLRQCEDADHGILFESRVCNGIGYRHRKSMYAINASASPAYTYLAEPLAPTFDDSSALNDVTITRAGGTSARVTDDTSPMGTASIGRYDTSDTLSLYGDYQCELHAAWLVHLGTVQDARYPRAQFRFETPALVSNAALTYALRSLDIGDRIDVTSPPSWCSYEPVRQLVIGLSEQIEEYKHAITFNTAPFNPLDVGIWSASRYQTPGSALQFGVNTTATMLSVTSSSVVWTTDVTALPFDIMIGGERMTVTAITGTTSPQSFTVTRSVNGVVKSHGIGAVVELADPGIFGL